MNHAIILEAYLARISDKHLKLIVEATNSCAHAQLNYGNLEQLKQKTKRFKAISDAVNDLLPLDARIIESIVNLEASE
jgi:hypothetical protein